LIAVVDMRLPAARARVLQEALLKMGHATGEADTLAQLHLRGFVPVKLPKAAAPP
jgi:hypothetical protein